MSYRAARFIVAAGLAVCSWSGLEAQTIVTPLFPGITHIKRTEQYPQFQCPGCGAPTPNPRLARMNILLVDLTSPAVHFKMTPAGKNLPAVAPGSTAANWPVVPFEVVKQRTLDFLNTSHAQAAINVHFFAPFPVPGSSTQRDYAYVIGLAASRGDVYSGFESPIQSYAIVTDSPGFNIDKSNNAGIVHRDPAFADGRHVLEDVELYNAMAGSAQIVTNGVKTIPEYTDDTHPDELLTPGPVPPLGPIPLTYTRAGRHWYDLSNARTAIGVTQDGATLVLFTVDGTNGGHGMQGGEVADLLINDYNVWNALNLDGGGSTTMAVEDPATHLRKLLNVPADNPPRLEATNFAVYSDAVDPATTATVTPTPNARGWNNTNVTVGLLATDLASGLNDTPAGWVDQLQYSLDGAQTSGPQVVPGDSSSVELSTAGVTTLTYFATDAAGNEEPAHALQVQLDGVAPVISGMPAAPCTLDKPKGKAKHNHKHEPKHDLRLVATVQASDTVSGVLREAFKVTATSNEPQSGKHPDIVIKRRSGKYQVFLSVEKPRRPEGRIYTIQATASDRADNIQTVTATCVVPRHGHDDDDDDDCDDDHHDRRGDHRR